MGTTQRKRRRGVWRASLERERETARQTSALLRKGGWQHVIPPLDSITVRPVNGLANRLHVLSSAVALGHRLNRKVRLLWGWPAKFEDLFELLDDTVQLMPGRYERWSRHVYEPYLYARKPTNKIPFSRDLLANTIWVWLKGMGIYDREYTRLDYTGTDDLDQLVADIAKSGPCYISSCFMFFPSRFANVSFLRPVAAIQGKIDAITSKLDRAHLVGVHIRRGEEYWPRLCPLDTFIRYMKYEIQMDDRVQFFVSCLHQTEKQQLRRIFGTRVVSCDAHPDRNSTAGWQDAVVDLYVLAEARKIIGSWYSSFTRQAGLLKGAPRYVVKEPDLSPASAT